MSDDVVLSSIDKRGVAWVSLNRPEVNNAYNADLLQAALDGLRAMAGDDNVRVVVLRGNGRHFQAGADLKWIRSVAAGTPQENEAASRLTGELVRTLNEFPKPTVALVHGACVGGGTGVIAACDVVIASEDATFAISEARWGLVANPIFPHLNAAMGSRNVRRYAQTCERFDAHTARQLGLVHEVCETGKLDDAVAPVLEGLLKAGPDALAETKRVVLGCAGEIMSEQSFEQLVGSHAAKRQTSEATEGLASFVEKRDPSWFRG